MKSGFKSFPFFTILGPLCLLGKLAFGAALVSQNL